MPKMLVGLKIFDLNTYKLKKKKKYPQIKILKTNFHFFLPLKFREIVDIKYSINLKSKLKKIKILLYFNNSSFEPLVIHFAFYGLEILCFYLVISKEIVKPL